MELNTIIQGDAREVLKTLPDNSINCCVTSPPYWGLRDYGVEGQIGLEKTPEEYVANMVGIFREVQRLAPAGAAGEAGQKEGVFCMAHTCPVCGMTCHCNGDIDDICLDLEEDILACTHCPDDEDDFEEDFWEGEKCSHTLAYFLG